MQDQLISKLHAYLVTNHLDLLISLQEDHRLIPYLTQKVASVKEFSESLAAEGRPLYVTEALCMEELTRDLRPSRFNYVKNLLEKDFESDYLHMKQSGILTWEIINLIGACEPIFEVFGFSETHKEDPEMHRAVADMISEYCFKEI